MKTALRAALLAVFVAGSFAVAAPQASADHDPGCTHLGSATVCAGTKGGVNIDVPLVHVCVRINHDCDGRHD
jgi:hypothetical protein